MPLRDEKGVSSYDDDEINLTQQKNTLESEQKMSQRGKGSEDIESSQPIKNIQNEKFGNWTADGAVLGGTYDP